MHDTIIMNRHSTTTITITTTVLLLYYYYNIEEDNIPIKIYASDDESPTTMTCIYSIP